ncbi:hypothetical protein SAMN02745164_01745 [Marinitoga hydrogenitolerans DSM 16785]|uniref:Uncharacterized protein n=1 Tax=Marinitoga hydrogenitolerans (strain DSM 16785 / JCM 12826 / AT1271) TaxID=1122195 RepID=A0A1M4YRP2_MARH1|nr:hypothetical protein [Marinitoga hydrogenitolerans]SHF08363.1 hypothetical protein SAMN02745164_01745 [Marinitoga hydrogenitolerans DSM 16785]
MLNQNIFRDFFVFSLIIFISLYFLLFFVNTKYIERTVEEIVNRSSISVVNIINEYSYKYINFSQDFSNDIRVSSYVKSLIYFSSNYDDSKSSIFDSVYSRLDDYIKEKKNILTFNGKIIISDFNKNIIYPQKVSLLNYTIFEMNLIELENSTELIQYSPVFSLNGKTYFYISTYLFDLNQIPIAYISFEINIDFSHLNKFSMEGLKFHIIDNNTKLIWPETSLPYFIYSKMFLSKEENKEFMFNGNLYYIRKTNFGNSIYILTIFTNKELYIYSFYYFILLSFFFSTILIFWMKRYFRYEIHTTKRLFEISSNLGIDDFNLINRNIKNMKHIMKSLFQDIETFEELENNIINAIRIYDDIIYISFYKKKNNEIDYIEYEIYSSENYQISNNTIDILKNTKNMYLYPFRERIFDLDGFFVIKEKKFGELESNIIFDGIVYMLKDLYIKINKIYNKDEMEKKFFERNFKTLLIVKFQEKVINLNTIDMFKSYIFKYKNNLIFLNTFDSKFNNEIIDYINIIGEFERINAKFISFKIPKYETRKKKLFREIEKILDASWDNVENSY